MLVWCSFHVAHDNHTVINVYVLLAKFLCSFVWDFKKHLGHPQVDTYTYNRIKIHDSESRGQEEADLRDEPVSYLQVAPL